MAGPLQLLAGHEAADLVAFGAAGERTAAHLVADARALAERLAAPEPGRDVLVVTDDRYHFAVSLLAAWSTGHAVALPPNSQGELIRAMAREPHILTLLHDADEDIGIDIRGVLDPGAEASSYRRPEALEPGRRVAAVYTSGSTGRARAHSKTAGQLLGEARALAEHFAVGSGSRVVATVPAHHIYGLLFSVLVPLVNGAAFCRSTPLHAEAVAGTLRSLDARVLVSVPAHLRVLRLLDDLPGLDTVFSSGAPLMPDVARVLLDRFGQVVTEVLGSTETGGMATRRSDGDGGWTALPGVSIQVGDEGRMLVDSPFLPPSSPRPFRSEDRIERLDDGRFVHLGRLDDVVKVAGKRVALGDIERQLRELDGVEDAAVTAVDAGGARGFEPVAIVVAPGLTPESIRTQLRRFLDPVVVPRRLKLVDGIERDERGKLGRARILTAFEAAAGSQMELELGEASMDVDGGTTIRRVRVRAPRDLFWFRGHFAAYPLVPGVVQLDLASSQARAGWDDLHSLARVLRLKFKRPIRPGESVVLELRRKDDRARVEFRIEAEDGLASSGVLDFAPRQAG